MKKDNKESKIVTLIIRLPDDDKLSKVLESYDENLCLKLDKSIKIMDIIKR